MEEEGAAKAPMTRLRRRLSVEVDETKSPSAPSTPTKKRGGRLAAKPQLELIDENAPQDSPSTKRTTRKSIASTLAEDEKPVTPARRSTRVKSNNSLVLETIQVDSPRAKRAARRNSQIGSDTEAPVTPARTRRTRKDSSTSADTQAIGNDTPVVTPAQTRKARTASTSSMDKIAEINASKPADLITTVISEEPESTPTKKGDISIGSKSDLNISPSQVRKSPRIASKTSLDVETNGDIKELPETRKSPMVSIKNRNALREDRETTKQDLESSVNNSTDNVVEDTNKLSVSSANLIKELDTQPKLRSNLNKSTSAMDKTTSFETKRQRTKSMTTLSITTAQGNEFLSDNESTKKRIPSEKLNSLSHLKGDKNSSSLNTSKTEDVQGNKSIQTPSKKKKKSLSECSMTNDADKSVHSEQMSTTKTSDVSTESNKEKVDSNAKNTEEAVELLFQNGPNKVVHSALFIEDSDSNTDSIQKENVVKCESEDQCVPEVDNQLHNNKSFKTSGTPSKVETQPTQEINIFNISQQQHVEDNECEPMDIDETMPENVSLHDSSTEKINDNVNTTNSKRKSSLNSQNSNGSLNSKLNKSKRKSSTGSSTSQNLEKSGIENKSTLVLSQLKDVSASDQSPSKSPRKNIDISKSQDVIDGLKDKIVNKNINISSNYLTSTPVQQKEDTKLKSLNTSVITPNDKQSQQQTSFTKNTSRKAIAIDSKHESSDDESSEDSLKSLLDDEADDVGDDYESGDSQNEEEREYVRANEIRDKGETLTSDDEVSNDTDYEMDSFVVSSDEEDKELLSGSGDDLDMSDNELTMNAKSKKKYNERNAKKQKKASREMFEARHGLNQSDKEERSPKPRNSNRLRLISSEFSGDDSMLPPKKNKRMRLNSTKEEDKSNNNSLSLNDSEIIMSKKKKPKLLSDSSQDNQEDVDEPDSKKKDVSNISETDVGYRKKKSKRLSESVCKDSVMNEKEITIRDATSNDGDDPLVVAIKQEPRTPQNSLDISTVLFTDRAEVEEINVNENVSMMKGNESIDPLQATMAKDENESDESISENEEATKKYDSILNELNKQTSKKIKSKDISLNLDKKTKKKAKQAIIEELNITQVKEKKKSKVEKVIIADDDGSDSIDLKLLFSDDSNDSEKNTNTQQSENQAEVNESVISLKRTEGKTNIHDNLDISTNMQDESGMNISLKSDEKKKKRMSESTATSDDNVLKDTPLFVIDTVGSMDPHDESLNISLKKKKNKNNSIVESKSLETSKANDSIWKYNNIIEIQNVSVLKTPVSEKKKKSNTVKPAQDVGVQNVSLNTSKSKIFSEVSQPVAEAVTSTSISKESIKKKRKRESSEHNDEPVPEAQSLTPSEILTESNKKKKLKFSDNASTITESVTVDKKIRKKRKEREDDELKSRPKIFKQNSFYKISVPRLPAAVIEELDDKPKLESIQAKKAKLIATTTFTVEQTTKRRTKPSNFLEESIYLNDSINLEEKPNQNVKKPKVLPFVPTATTSYSGFTTNFHVNVLPKRIDFVAKSSDVPNFKNSKLESHKCKIRAEKRRKNIQLSKY